MKGMNENHYDTIIIGAGPAGLSAGIYASRAKLKTLILNEGTVGGQLVLTHEIVNYPGVKNSSGYMLGNTMKEQAESFGCKIRANLRITNMDLDSETKMVEVNGKDVYTSETIILSPGGKSRSLGVSGEDEFKGKGISYCATCDGDFFQDKNIIVVGGGNSALEEAVSLTKYASKVTIVHQFDHFQAFPHAVEEARLNDKIDFLMESRIVEFTGGEKLQKVKIENIRSGEVSQRDIDGVFIFIGYMPNTASLDGIVELNEWGEIPVNSLMETNLNGIYAAGDCIPKRFRQVTTAVADGTIAALSAADYIHKNKNEEVLEV